jgi:hypothetical protein
VHQTANSLATVKSANESGGYGTPGNANFTKKESAKNCCENRSLIYAICGSSRLLSRHPTWGRYRSRHVDLLGPLSISMVRILKSPQGLTQKMHSIKCSPCGEFPPQGGGSKTSPGFPLFPVIFTHNLSCVVRQSLGWLLLKRAWKTLPPAEDCEAWESLTTCQRQTCM